MAVNNDYPSPPQNPRAEIGYIRKLMVSLVYAMKGKLNCTGELTLTASATSTVVENTLCNENSVVLLTPETANAAGEIGGGTLYIVPGVKQFTVTHANAGTTDRRFRYVIIG